MNPTMRSSLLQCSPLPLLSPSQAPSFRFANNLICLRPSLFTAAASSISNKPVQKRRDTPRKPSPGEREGICQEMRFVAMRLRNEGGEGEGEETWQPSMEGFVKYLVDSKLVFDTVERIINESSDVAYVHFRKTGLERSDSLAADLERLKEQGIVIPEPSSPGINYSNYLKELAETSSPSFLCHYYNIYFSHITGGVGIGKKVCEKLFEGREIEFYKWDGDAQLLLKDVRESLNQIGAHWSRDEKNKCLKEAAKSFRYLGQIVRLMITL
ncbi:hypothetical protein LUZ60_006599 [Juncus effusus]|nr:hypothetical protein LUZ60_006599 [Juncus effusus]